MKRQNNNFIPTSAKKIFNSLTDEGDSQVDFILKKFNNFHDCCLSHIQLWENSFGGSESFVWIKNKIYEWPQIEASAEKINALIGKAIINTDDLFDEVVLTKSFWSSKSDDWKEERGNKWVELFNFFKDQNMVVPNLKILMGYIFCLPGTSAPVERLFSLMNSIWWQERGHLNQMTVEGLLCCKINIDLSCSEFF